MLLPKIRIAGAFIEHYLQSRKSDWGIEKFDLENLPSRQNIKYKVDVCVELLKKISQIDEAKPADWLTIVYAIHEAELTEGNIWGSSWRADHLKTALNAMRSYLIKNIDVAEIKKETSRLNGIIKPIIAIEGGTAIETSSVDTVDAANKKLAALKYEGTHEQYYINSIQALNSELAKKLDEHYFEDFCNNLINDKRTNTIVKDLFNQLSAIESKKQQNETKSAPVSTQKQEDDTMIVLDPNFKEKIKEAILTPIDATKATNTDVITATNTSKTSVNSSTPETSKKSPLQQNSLLASPQTLDDKSTKKKKQHEDGKKNTTADTNDTSDDQLAPQSPKFG